MIRKIFLSLLLMMSTVVNANTQSHVGSELKLSELQSIEINEQYTHVHLTLSGDVKTKQFTLSNPDRIVVDLNDAQFRLKPPVINQNDIIRTLRIAQFTKQQLRLVFELNQPATLSLKKNYDAVLKKTVVDLELSAGMKIPEHQSVEFKLIKTPAVVTTATNSVNKPSSNNNVVNANNTNVTANSVNIATSSRMDSPLPFSNQVIPNPITVSPKKMRDVVVIIDAGHGGHDPGAIGSQGTKEKNITLAIAKELERIINLQPGIKAFLTRGDDNYIALRERLNLSRKYHGDIFISIHADAYKDPSSHGASVFALSQSGASSEAARWLAEKENSSELGGVELKDKSYMLKSVLLDLSQTATISSSLDMGERIINYFKNFTSLHKEGVEQARFVVLKSPDTPSLLVETGFISNLNEENKLSDPGYRHELATAIWRGVEDYFSSNPPRGTAFEHSRSARRV